MDLEHERRLVAVEERSKSNSHRLTAVEEKQDKLDDLVSGINALAIREERVEKDVAEIKVEVKDINAKPGKRTETVITGAISAVVGGLISYIFFRLGLGG